MKTFKGKDIIIILDNASFHNCKKVKRYLRNNKMVHLLYLPPYSPEYNPVELIWKWLKPKIYGFHSFGRIEELLKRFRKYIWHYNDGRLERPINLNLDIYLKVISNFAF